MSLSKEPLSGDPVPAAAAAVRVHPGLEAKGTIRLPGSKSLTNRALLVAGLAEGESVLRGALDCDDSRYLAAALRQLGVSVQRDEADGTFWIQGAGGPFAVPKGRFFLGNAGTACRFLTAALAATPGEFLVDGDARMRERPIRPLVRALRELGADVEAPSGCPPVTLGHRVMTGGRVDIPGNTSSQFISAILMAAPVVRRRVEVRVTGELVSGPYLELTLQCMRQFGARVSLDEKRPDGLPLFRVDSQPGYRGREFTVEGDASAASYFLAAAAVTGATVRVEGLGKESIQGDARFADVLAAMGCRVLKEREAITVTGGLLRKVDWDCGDIPDVVPTLAVTALFAKGKTRLWGVSHLRYKESDRIVSVATELRKLGAQVTELRDGLEIRGTLGDESSPLHGAVIDSWGDHRIAMALSIAALVIPGVVIERPQVVAKSFPGFFDALESLGARVEFVEQGSTGSAARHGDDSRREEKP